MLRHPNIVRFEDCFEDEENVYMVLELCDHGVSYGTPSLVIELTSRVSWTFCVDENGILSSRHG